MGQQHRQFSPEFKAGVVVLVRSSDRSISAVAREFGIGESNLGYWLKKDEANRKTRDPGRFATESVESAENRALRDRVAELEVERGILKRVTAVWVKESRAPGRSHSSLSRSPTSW
jgi:transposase